MEEGMEFCEAFVCERNTNCAMFEKADTDMMMMMCVIQMMLNV